MTQGNLQELDNFCSGHLIVNKHRKITFCNAYICNLSDKTEAQLVESSISEYISKASNIFIDSYIYPLLINESEVQEVQITWIGDNGQKIPVVANIKLGQQGESYWSLYMCANRDKLHSELLKANEKLEQQSQALFDLATTDPLTGLLNRRELQAQVNKVIYQVTRTLSTFALLSIDVDFFKKVNDTYGHQKGDLVLTSIAEMFTQELRANDILARVGGEEFVILLQDVDVEQALKLSEKIRTMIETTSIDDINITVSIGLVVTRKLEEVDFDMLLKLSDDALYNAKNTGRNKTCLASH
ncbi:sensor domain-containing diguanylate cyclase [Shewanella donghaensis]|uniref:sensor domain-containing diguanylate cyclase n=1 Tax=Shewanella donghaensis TaxID=238836 RepID=UPI0011827C33|nr:GGDEF domain-containing protein [Shewanella donghaensis]